MPTEQHNLMQSPVRHCASGGNPLNDGTKRDAEEFHRTANMTGMLEHETPGLGHNKPSEEDADEIKHGKWERWAKKRTFVRALEGTYSHLYKIFLEGSSVEGRTGDVRQARDLATGGEHRTIDRVAYRMLRAAQCRAEARPSQQRGVLRAQ